MSDIKSKEARSKNMAAIRSKETKPEIYFRKLLFARGFRYRKNVNYIVGHPDIYLAKYHTAIFVHGCFWHRHIGCKYAYIPKSRVDFWQKKFGSNVARDQLVRETLRAKNVKCLIVWECTINKMKKSATLASEIIDEVVLFLKSDAMFLEL